MTRSRSPALAALLCTILPPMAAPVHAESVRADAAAHRPAEHTPGVGHPSAPPEDSPPEQPALVGQYAFATIAEIVHLLERDPTTDWSRVDLERLRQHLIDMDRVTIAARVRAEPVAGGARFEVSAERPEALESIRRMTRAHAATAEHDPEGLAWRYTLEERSDGVALTVTGEGSAEAERVRALGFIGTLVAGSHHGRHHLAIARGDASHEH